MLATDTRLSSWPLNRHNVSRIHSASGAMRPPYKWHCIRYVLILARQQRIGVDRPPRQISLGLKELEVVELKEFLGAMAPEIAHDIIHRRIREVGERIARKHYEGPLVLKYRISVLYQADVAEMLMDFLEDARKLKKILRAIINERRPQR